MKYDDYGQVYITTDDLCNLIYKDPKLHIENFLVEDPENYNKSIKYFHSDLPLLKKYVPDVSNQKTLEQFDHDNQEHWYMPDSYKDLDIRKYIISLCTTDIQLQRIEQELILFQEKNLFNLLKFLKYLVDTLREHSIVWGVGRGSSVSSYVLYLLGVHKIDSIKYNLDIKEFLK